MNWRLWIVRGVAKLLRVDACGVVFQQRSVRHMNFVGEPVQWYPLDEAADWGSEKPR